MAKGDLSGKLAVILHADVAGSTQLVQQDEQLSHERIQDAFRRFSDTIGKYHGRVQELRGDALLAEFERASDAVTAALSFQSDQHDHLEKIIDDIKPEIRVGIALGEVVIADSTVTGAGVVLAQRVEQLAKPGELCITSAIHEALPSRMPFSFDNLGEQVLKGFDDQVRVYRVQLRAGESVPLPQRKSRHQVLRKDRWPRIAIAMVVAMVAVAIGYWAKYSPSQEEPASMENMVFQLPDRPSIAVMPFTNMSGAAEQEYFADGMTESLITDLSKISGLFVIARNSSFSYKGQQVKVRQVAEDLGVRYVLEGSVQRAGDRVRINAQLIDATTGGHLWADRYDGSLADIFALQDQVATKIVNAMSVTLTTRELEGLGSFGTSNVAAHDAFLQGLSFYVRSTPTDNANAEKYFLRALEVDPGFKRAHALLASVYYKAREPEYSRAMGIYWRKAVLFAYRSLARIEGDDVADAHVVRSAMALTKHQVRIALQEAERALAISPNSVDALKAKARALIFLGEHEAGREIANQVIRTDPAAIAEPLFLLGLSNFATESYVQSVKFLKQALENDPATSKYTRLLSAAYGKLGMTPEANQAWLRFRENWHWPHWIAAEVYEYPFEDGRTLDHLADGLKAAGAAERPPARFWKLDRETRLTGPEVESLLFGQEIRGSDFSDGTSWIQKRTLIGEVTQSGTSFYTGNAAIEEGIGWIEDNRLCERWNDTPEGIVICVLIFRDTARGKGNYLLANDLGPQPFQIVVSN